METSYQTVALASAVIGVAAVLALSSGPAETPNLGEMQEDDEKVCVIVGDCNWAQEFPDGEIRPGLTVKKLNDDIQAVINAFMHIGSQEEDGGEETEAWQTFTNEAGDDRPGSAWPDFATPWQRRTNVWPSPRTGQSD
jgi:hypothetical protein